MTNSGLTTVAQAQQQLLHDVHAVTEQESCALADCVGRVLASDVVATVDVPPADNSAMDGYALATTAPQPDIVAVTQTVFAGQMPEPLRAGTAARIFTGATIPVGADAVVMQENCTAEDKGVRVDVMPACGENIRRKGQDIENGAVVLPKGTRLDARSIGLAASVGCATLPVYRPLRIAILSTGDELLEPGEPAADNKIYNSNRYVLSSLLQSNGIEVVDAGMVADDKDATAAAIGELATRVDMIISSGGVSVGDADFVKAVITELGSLDFWKLAMKPGKPLAYGRINNCVFFGLPGNPVSVFASFAIIVQPYLRCMQGVSTNVLPTPLPVVAGFEIARPGNRQEYLRVRLSLNPAGQTVAELFANQSSGVLSSLQWADGFAVLAPGKTVQAGDTISYLPFTTS